MATNTNGYLKKIAQNKKRPQDKKRFRKIAQVKK